MPVFSQLVLVKVSVLSGADVDCGMLSSEYQQGSKWATSEAQKITQLLEIDHL